MNRKIESLPIQFLSELGTCGLLEWLPTLPELENIPRGLIFQTHESRPYYLQAEGYGLTLTLQYLNPLASAEEKKWGFQGFTLDASWKGAWFPNLSIRETRADTLIPLLATSTDEVMHQHPMLCFEVQGMGDQAWSVVATFDTPQKTLNTFSLVRVGDWREAPTTIAHQDAIASEAVAQTNCTGEALTCLSGAKTPATGVWEAGLPPAHPQARMFGQAPHRFVFKRAGDAMGTLGLPSFDEAMVVWIWRRSR